MQSQTWLKWFSVQNATSFADYKEYYLIEHAPNALKRLWRVYYEQENNPQWRVTLGRAGTGAGGFIRSVNLPQKMQDILIAFVQMSE